MRTSFDPTGSTSGSGIEFLQKVASNANRNGVHSSEQNFTRTFNYNNERKSKFKLLKRTKLASEV
jgi:hypothetical protein